MRTLLAEVLATIERWAREEEERAQGTRRGSIEEKIAASYRSAARALREVVALEEMRAHAVQPDRKPVAGPNPPERGFLKP